jgi:syntaxin 16
VARPYQPVAQPTSPKPVLTTARFVSYRQSYAHHPSKKPRFSAPDAFPDAFPEASSAAEERRGLISAAAFDDDAAGDTVIEMDLLPPRWLDAQDEVAAILADAAADMRRLDTLTQKHLLPGFDDEDVRAREEREIERLAQRITRRFHECQVAIKRIESVVYEARLNGSLGRAEETMANNLKVSLATRVGEASGTFRKKQSAYLKS